MTKPRVVVIGAGPAGLTAAYELVKAGITDVVVLEATRDIGGLSKTVNYNGNRIDIGGHRFFSKSDWVMEWWLNVLPLARSSDAELSGKSSRLAYQGRERVLTPQGCADPSSDQVMLIRSRLSRILFDGKFFDYPLKADVQTAWKLGIWRCIAFGLSYVRSALFPRSPERTLEDFFINRFGRRLYRQFFKEYTEKVWGTSCDRISAEWGAQRVKGLSVAKALRHAVLKLVGHGRATAMHAEQTSLIEQFLYPKYGPGLMWETVAARIRALGVSIELGAPVARLDCEGRRIASVYVRETDGGERRYDGEFFISTMPVRDLVQGLGAEAPARVREVAAGLEYRDFITVGLLYRRLLPNPGGEGDLNIVPDNWIYVQEPGVRVGRLQIFNNWSPHMVRDKDTVWIGMEYFCHEGDDLWRMTDDELIRLGIREMERLRLASAGDQLDGVVVRMPKAYPGYYGSYAHFDEIRAYLDGIPNLFLAGRNGMHRYNNQDHSMLSAKLAVEAIVSGSADKSAIWSVNIDDEYHEQHSGGKDGH